MTKRDEQRRQADRNFSEVRKAIAAQSTEWLCDALREIPHRKWIEIEKDQHVAVGALAHRAADRIIELEKALRWHVPSSHDKFCDVQEGKSQCNCGFDLLNRTL